MKAETSTYSSKIDNLKDIEHLSNEVLHLLITDHFSYKDSIVQTGEHVVFAQDGQRMLRHFLNSFNDASRPLNDAELFQMLNIGSGPVFETLRRALVRPDIYPSHDDTGLDVQIYTAYFFVHFLRNIIPPTLVRDERYQRTELGNALNIAKDYAEKDFHAHKETDLLQLCHLQRLIKAFPHFLESLDNQNSPNLHRLGQALFKKLNACDAYLKTNIQERVNCAAMLSTRRLEEIRLKPL